MNEKVATTANQLAKDIRIPGKLNKVMNELVTQSIPFALQCTAQLIKNQQSIAKNDLNFSKNCEKVIQVLQKAIDDPNTSDVDKKNYINQAFDLAQKQYNSNVETKALTALSVTSISLTLVFIIKTLTKTKK